MESQFLELVPQLLWGYSFGALEYTANQLSKALILKKIPGKKHLA